MSHHEEYINELLEEKYTHEKSLKSSEYMQIDLYSHVESGKKLLKLLSVNRNDDIFRRLCGRKCPNLPLIYEVCAFEKGLCVLEEYIEGRQLSEILAEGTLSQGDALSYFFDICSALSFLHAHSVIHRDVKPANIIITPDGRAVLIDLNSSREYSSEVDGDTVNLGTPGYAAPEQFGIHQSTPATDIYALGILLNEMLLDISPIVKTPEGRLGKIIKKCISSQISERYQSIGELTNDLEAYRRKHPIKAKK